RVLGEEVAAAGALLRLGLRRTDRLAHLQRHQPRVVREARAQLGGRGTHQRASLREALSPPRLEGALRPGEPPAHLRPVVLGIVLDRFTGGGIDRFHEWSQGPSLSKPAQGAGTLPPSRCLAKGSLVPKRSANEQKSGQLEGRPDRRRVVFFR